MSILASCGDFIVNNKHVRVYFENMQEFG